MAASPQPQGRKPVSTLIVAVIAAFVMLGIPVIIALQGSDDGASAGSTTKQQQTASGDTAPGGAAGAGSLTANGESLLPVPDDLATYVGQDAEGRGVEVQSVVEGEGFWVGTSQTDRAYVEYGAEVGENEPDASAPAVGDKVNLTGPVRPAPEEPGRTLRLQRADEKLVREQGAFINADSVESA